MSRVVLSGYYGFCNLGDEAILGATVDALRDRRPGLDIAVLTATPQATSGTYGVEGVPRNRPREIVRTLRGCDVYLSGGGSLFQDATSWRSPWYYLGVLALARRLARRTVIYAQGIGPLRGRTVRLATRRLLNAVDLITLRDRESLGALDDLGIHRPRVVLAADPSLLLRPEWSARAQGEKARWGEGTHFGLALRPWEGDRVLDVVSAAAKMVADRLGVRWICLPMHPPGDLTAAEQVAARIGPAAEVVRVRLAPREMLALIGSLALLVGMRFHALVFAAAGGVPVIPVAYDPKVAAFAHELGETALDAARLETSALVEAIETAAADLPGRRDRLLGAVAPLRARAALAPEAVADLIA